MSTVCRNRYVYITEQRKNLGDCDAVTSEKNFQKESQVHSTPAGTLHTTMDAQRTNTTYKSNNNNSKKNKEKNKSLTVLRSS